MTRPAGPGHLSIGVADIGHSARFYDAVLAAIGFVRKWSDEDAIGYGPGDGGDPVQIVEKAGAAPPSHFAVITYRSPGVIPGIDRGSSRPHPPPMRRGCLDGRVKPGHDGDGGFGSRTSPFDRLRVRSC
ncbi:MAG: hypothetical protein ACTHOR_04990 [Devosia sp.]